MAKIGSNGRQQCNNEPMTRAAKSGNGWCRDHLRKVVNDWHQKQQTTRVLMVAQWSVMTKAGSGGGQKCNNKPKTGAAKGGWWLVSRPLEGSG
jgi:hypothetical protein